MKRIKKQIPTEESYRRLYIQTFLQFLKVIKSFSRFYIILNYIKTRLHLIISRLDFYKILSLKYLHLLKRLM